MSTTNIIDDNSLSFVSPEFLDNLPSMSGDEIDAINFGVIQVDDRGMVLIYNKYQAELENIPKALTKGKNYFTQIMPCTCNRLFYERFKVGVSLNNLDYVLAYVLTYRIPPTEVKIHLFRESNTRTNWILMQKK